jgi:hypothetical protein
LPENLFAAPQKREKRSFEYLKYGIVFTVLGLAFWGVFAHFWFFAGKDDSVGFFFVAAFFTAFGVAWLLIGYLKKQQEKQETSKTKDE